MPQFPLLETSGDLDTHLSPIYKSPSVSHSTHTPQDKIKPRSPCPAPSSTVSLKAFVRASVPLSLQDTCSGKPFRPIRPVPLTPRYAPPADPRLLLVAVGPPRLELLPPASRSMARACHLAAGPGPAESPAPAPRLLQEGSLLPILSS